MAGSSIVNNVRALTNIHPRSLNWAGQSRRTGTAAVNIPGFNPESTVA